MAGVIVKIVFVIGLICPISLSASEMQEMVMKQIYRQAYDYVKVRYVKESISVSYYMEDTDMYYFFSNRLTGKQKELVEHNYFEKRFKVEDDKYDIDLYEIFSESNRRIETSDYELWFSYPLGNMIICTLYPYGKRHSKFGSVMIYLFCYNKSGIINEMIQRHVSIN